jgi:transcription-repair coupling factor (superfamily II helicase)
LIQQRPKEFKLDGSDKLRFFRDMSEPQRRLREVSEVVAQLTG